MFIFLSKFLPLFVYPVGITTLLLLISLLLRKNKKFSTLLLLAAFMVIFISGNRWIAYSLARTLEWKYLPDTKPQSAEAIVVLGGGTEAMQPPRTAVEMNGASDRMIHAADLYHAKKAPILLLSGGNIAWMESLENSPANDMQQILLRLGVPEKDMLLQTKSQNTHEDAVYSAEILKAKNIHRIFLVTSAMHMPRSVALFEKQGLEVIPAPADFTVTEIGWQQTFSPNFETLLTDLIPSSSALGLTTNVMKEYIGTVIYRLQGWL
jgi:uncharacterized SAM-binding protein YcdF (DUF218 family)